MLRVGLTGGIASGKSFVATELRRLGLPVIDADELARRVVEPGQPALEAIVERFGASVVDLEGRLDRSKLGRIVFADQKARSDLEAITHPRIAAAAESWLKRQEVAGATMAVYEAPLIFETGLEAYLDIVVLVAATEETQLRRLIARDGLAEDEARQRLAAQMPTNEKTRRAHLVIWNDATLDDLRERVNEVYQELIARAR